MSSSSHKYRESSRDRPRDSDRDRERRARHDEFDVREGGSRDQHRDRDSDRRYRESSRYRDSDGERRRNRSRDKDRDRDRRRDKSPGDRSPGRKRKSSPSESSHKHRKEHKQARREAKLAEEASASRALAEVTYYSTLDNPFADNGQQFKWAKKAEKEKSQGISEAEAARRDAIRRQEATEELARISKRRADREVEMQLREEEDARLARLNESAQMGDWLAKEDQFHLDQARKRAAIRTKDGRARPIDFLALNLKFADPTFGQNEDEFELEMAGLEVDISEPYSILEDITLDEATNLHGDIRMYLELETVESNLDFWRNMLICCQDKIDSLSDSNSRATDPGVRQRIDSLLSGKSKDELLALQDSVRAKLASGQVTDRDYWEDLLNSILVHRSKSKLREVHEHVLLNRLDQLRKKQRHEAEIVNAEVLRSLELKKLPVAEETDHHDIPSDAAPVAQLALQFTPDMEPVKLDKTKIKLEDRSVRIVQQEADAALLHATRGRISSKSFIAKPIGADELLLTGKHIVYGGASGSKEDKLQRAEMSKGMDDDEEIFAAETAVPSESLSAQPTHWDDKYRPRKPKYFNRVHTGYEWNKYNQTHYDSSDNPPPKVVQGYKFNIFYPDLIDKTKAPTYLVVKDPTNPDVSTLIFKAGPPYQDVAFTIVRKDWEYSSRRGFRSSFDRGVLSLYFSFKRTWYRK